MKIQNVTDASFRKYGKIITEYSFEKILKEMEHTPLPKDVVYVPSVEELEVLPEAAEICKKGFGGLPIQIGYCNGDNHKLNALEYHRSSELDIAQTDLILLLGSEKEKRWKEMEPVLVDALKSCTQDGSISGCFLSYGRRGGCQKDILLSYRQAKEAGKALSWLGWGKSVCYDDVPPEKPWIDDAKKQRDKFYQLIMDNDEKGSLPFSENDCMKNWSAIICA